MLFTSSLLSRGSFLGSLMNKVRSVVNKNHKQTYKTHDKSDKKNNFSLPLNSTSTSSSTNSKTTAIIVARPPIAAAGISVCSPTGVATKTLEEKVGLPPRPKKPLTPYFRYMRDMRPKLLAENPSISSIDIVRTLSKRWETVEPTLKERLQAEYKKDQQVYLEQRTKYDAKLTDEQRAEIKQLKQDIVEAKERKLLRKRVKELGRPKKPASAFLRFIAYERKNTPQNPQQTYREWHQKATAKWARLTDAEKQVFMQESRKELDAYKVAISIWEEKMIRLGHVDVVRHANLIDPPEPKPRKPVMTKESKN